MTVPYNDDSMCASTTPVGVERPRSAIREDRDDRWAAKIRTAWQKSIEGILETGRLLIDAKADLPHGGFEIMVRSQLPFSNATAQRLMAIARQPQLSKAAHVQVLPASWGTLYELTKLDAEELGMAFQKRLIKPELERKDVPGVRARVHRALGRRVAEPAKETVRRDFFGKMRTHTAPELRAILNSFPTEITAEIAVAVADMLISLLVTNSAPQGRAT